MRRTGRPREAPRGRRELPPSLRLPSQDAKERPVGAPKTILPARAVLPHPNPPEDAKEASENMLARANAMRGITIYCAETPTKISLGLPNTLMKSSIFSVVPIPKRITPKRIFIIFTPMNSSITQLKVLGLITAITTAIKIIIKKYFSTNLKILFINLIYVKSIYKSLDIH